MTSGVPARRSGKYLPFVLFGVVAVAVVWTQTVSFEEFARQHRREAERQLVAFANLKADDLARWRKERIGDATTLVGNGVLARLVRGVLEGDEARTAELRSWLGRIQEAYQYESALLLDAGHRVRLAVPGRPGQLGARLSFVSPASEARLRAGNIVFEDFHRDETDHRIYLTVLAPVLDETEGNPLLAVVALRIDPETFLYPFIARWPSPDLTAETFLVRRDGSDVLYLSDLKYRKGSTLSFRMPMARIEVPAVKAVLEERGIVEGPDYRGVHAIAAVQAVPDSPWFVVVRVDAAEILGPVRERGWRTAAFSGLLLVAAAAVIGLGTRLLGARVRQERVKADEALRKSEDRLRAITQSARDAILMMDGDGRVSFWNPAAERILGYTADEAVGRNLHDLIAPGRFHEAHLAAYPRFQRSGEGAAVGQTLELAALRKDGSEIAVALSLSAVLVDGSWHAVGILRDITAQKKAEEDLRRALEEKDEANERLEATSALANHMAREADSANLAKSQFLANMSHEIRTPMNGVLGMTDLLLDSDLTDEQRRFASVVRSSAESLLGVINDILDFSKIEAGKLELEELDFDLRRMLEDVAEMLAPRAQEKGLELAYRIDPEMPTLLTGDPGRLRQVLVNLVGNAIKFTPKGEVAVEIRPTAETDRTLEARFEVRDTGIGIPDGKVALLFEAFQQVDASTTRRFGGSGLGLAICKHLARLMGGEIGVTSVDRRGSTFWFTALLRKQETPRVEEVEQADVRGVRVLAVDDSATNRLVLSEQLSSWGMRYDDAESAVQALGMLRAAVACGDPYRIVITDMQMPVTDGEALGRAVKADPALRDALLVMMTSLGLRGDARRLEEIGFSAYLTKPVKQSQLHDCLATVLGRSLKANRVQPAPLATRHTLGEARRRSFRVLVAEDNATNQEVALRLLDKLGVRADAVANGQEAVRALETVPYDLVFMDVQMPVMDGFEATRAIRSGSTRVSDPRVPVVAMTAHAMKGDRERCLSAGMDDYVPKPIEPAALAAVLDRWLPKDDDVPLPLAPAATARVPPKGLPVFDRAGFESRLMGDAELVAEISREFLEDIPRRLAALGELVREGRADETAKGAHAIRGACANVGALAMSALAAELEAAGNAGRIEEAAALLQGLEEQFSLLVPRMKEVQG